LCALAAAWLTEEKDGVCIHYLNLAQEPLSSS